jgi:hypothetical protein
MALTRQQREVTVVHQERLMIARLTRGPLYAASRRRTARGVRTIRIQEIPPRGIHVETIWRPRQ